MQKFIFICSLLVLFLLNAKSQELNDSLDVKLITTDSLNIPDSTAFIRPYPNPFGPDYSLKFKVKEKSIIKVDMYDDKGNFMHTLINKELNPGKFRIEYNLLMYKSGIYYFKLTTGDLSDTFKTLMVK